VDRAHQLLQKHWGYDTFRPLQEDIIQSVVEGNDTLALLPTGGGKSICYQIPALMRGGICLVISPLIALMNDQAQHLLDKGIRSLILQSGMDYKQIENTLNNAISGHYPFLFVSPERLKSSIFKQFLIHLPIETIAIDEAHCISQWGYDFRPPYLEIASIRETHPKAVMIALTASATQEVRTDIIEKLAFKKNHEVFLQSFDRPNIVYGVSNVEDKYGKMLSTLQKVKGTALVYVRNRRATKEVADWLIHHNISAGFYHAGLTIEERQKQQSDWLSGKVPVMVCTNAFGMGIDKPNVRLVVHLGLPNSLEEYYQEAGRAGRDGKISYALLLAFENDRTDALYKIANYKPSIQEIREIYYALHNHLQIPLGSGENVDYPLSLQTFAQHYKLKPDKIHQCLIAMAEEGIISYHESLFQPSTIQVIVDEKTLYKLYVDYPLYEPLIKTLLRTYGGIFDIPIKIDEAFMAKKAGLSISDCLKQLKYLNTENYIIYQKKYQGGRITYLQPIIDKNHLNFDFDRIRKQKEAFTIRMENMIQYAFSKEKCLSKLILSYFSEDLLDDCGHCAYCIQIKKNNIEELNPTLINEKIVIDFIRENQITYKILVDTFSRTNDLREQTIKIIRHLMDENVVYIDVNNYLRLG